MSLTPSERSERDEKIAGGYADEPTENLCARLREVAENMHIDSLGSDIDSFEAGRDEIALREIMRRVVLAESELRSSLAREAEAKKDVERVTWLEHALRHRDSELGTCIGDVFLSGGHRGIYVEVGDKVQESRGQTLREALDVLAAPPKEITKP